MKSIRKWLYRMVYSVAFVALYYMVFAYFFDTPIEHEVKKSTNQLTSRYNELVASLDSMNRVVNNIKERDSSIFEIVFEAKPYVDTTGRGRHLSAEHLENLSNIELSEMFDSRLRNVDSLVASQNSLMYAQLHLVDSLQNEMNRIPAIQPTYNPDLVLLAASYGNRIHPFYKTRHFHKGVDYAVPVGTAVFATADGVVEKIETKGKTSGLGIMIHHGKYKTFYGNLDKVLVKTGRKVMKGDIIAFSGDSGMSYAPHLHYEVLLDGVQVNPLPYFFGELDIYEIEKMRNIASVAMQSFD